jgi:hypothetical protein
VAKYDACGGIMTQGDDVAAGRESVQRREATIDVHAPEGASEAGSMDQKAAALRPEGTTQRQPNARSEVIACSGTCLVEMCVRSVDQTDGGVGRAMARTTRRRSESLTTLLVMSRAMTTRTDAT